MKIENVSIVLVEPQGAMNIGSVSRAMMNFGLIDLRLVNPCHDYHSLDSKRMAMKSEKILTNAKVYNNLKSAIEDRHIIMGTTRRFGKYRDEFISPEQAAENLQTSSDRTRAALVFGREDRGLQTKELDLCQFFITIPTSSAYPSMNLAQAVSLLMYEVRKSNLKDIPQDIEGREMATGEDLERMYDHMQTTLLEIEYINPHCPDHILRSFRRLFGRAGLSDREVRILQGLWSRIDWIENQRKKLIKN